MLVRPSVCPSVISRFSIKNGQTIIIQTTQIANVVVRCKRSWWNYPKWGEVGKICDIQQITHMSEMTQDSDMCIIQRVHKTPPLSIMVKYLTNINEIFTTEFSTLCAKIRGNLITCFQNYPSKTQNTSFRDNTDSWTFTVISNEAVWLFSHCRNLFLDE